MTQQAIALGATYYGLDRLVFSSARNGLYEQARNTLEQSCAQTGETAGNCKGYRVLLLAATGKKQQAEMLLDQLVLDIENGKHPVGVYTHFALASLYLEVGNISKVTDQQKQGLDANDWFPTNVLVFAPGGAKLPEEISTDPEWLAVWADPRLKDVTSFYRQNLLAWRAGRSSTK